MAFMAVFMGLFLDTGVVEILFSKTYYCCCCICLFLVQVEILVIIVVVDTNGGFNGQC